MKRIKGKKIAALLLSAMIISSSSAIVYAVGDRTSEILPAATESTQPKTAKVKWLKADLTTESMVSQYVSDTVSIEEADGGYAVVITLNEDAVSLISAVINPDGTEAEKLADDQYRIIASTLEEEVAVEFTVSAMGSTQTAYMVVEQYNEEKTDIAEGLAAGTYSLTAKAITASTYGSENPSEFALTRQFDANIKLIVSESRNWQTGETTKALKIALLYKPSSIDMIKLAIDDTDGTKREFGTGTSGTAYEFVMDIADLKDDHKLSFSYDTGRPNLGDNGVMTHSVYLTDYAVSDWNGYSWSSDNIPADGEYTLSAKAVTESTYGSENPSEFALTRQFDPKIRLTVKDGKAALSLLYLPSTIDMIQLAIDDTAGTKTAFGEDENGTAYEFTMPVTDLTKDRKLSFTYNTGRFVMTHSVYLTELQTAEWNGYDWKEPVRELVNTSSVESENIALGTSLKVDMSAEGGEGEYVYSVLYKKATGTKWTVAQKPTDNTTAVVKPAAEGQYYVMVKAKDKAGSVVKKYFVVNVENRLKNNSTVSMAEIKLGDTVTVNATAKGTTGKYQYAVMYKKLTSEKWTVAQKYGKNAEITLTPGTATDYEICVKAKDSNGAVAKKYFIISVKK